MDTITKKYQEQISAIKNAEQYEKGSILSRYKKLWNVEYKKLLARNFTQLDKKERWLYKLNLTYIYSAATSGIAILLFFAYILLFPNFFRLHDPENIMLFIVCSALTFTFCLLLATDKNVYSGHLRKKAFELVLNEFSNDEQYYLTEEIISERGSLDYSGKIRPSDI